MRVSWGYEGIHIQPLIMVASNRSTWQERAEIDPFSYMVSLGQGAMEELWQRELVLKQAKMKKELTYSEVKRIILAEIRNIVGAADTSIRNERGACEPAVGGQR